MITFLQKHPWASLLVLSIFCGALWRLEVEYHGWEGLIWTSYFHWAVPISALLMIAWTNLYISLNWKRQLLLNGLFVAYGVLLFFGIQTSLYYNFETGPSAMITFLNTPRWLLILWRAAILVFVPFLPVGIFLLLRLFKQRVPIKYLLFSLGGMLIAIPLSLFLLDLFNHKGSPDVLHAIKSGILVPFWMIALGVIVIGHIRKNKAVSGR